MKKILVFMLCIMVFFVTPIVTFAEGGEVNEEAVGMDVTVPSEEIPTEEEILPPTETPPTFEEEVEIVTDNIVEWLEGHTAEIGVIVTLIGYGIVIYSKLRVIIKSSGTINNNAIAISQTSKDFIAQALAKIENASGVVTGYEERIASLLEHFAVTAEEKLRLEKELVEVKNYLKIAMQSNLEFADELGELLALSNIPNFKKEEIGARHAAAKKDIFDAEAKAEAAASLPTPIEEVKENVGEES